jgi:hypothetical protein
LSTISPHTSGRTDPTGASTTVDFHLPTHTWAQRKSYIKFDAFSPSPHTLTGATGRSTTVDSPVTIAPHAHGRNPCPFPLAASAMHLPTSSRAQHGTEPARSGRTPSPHTLTGATRPRSAARLAVAISPHAHGRNVEVVRDSCVNPISPHAHGRNSAQSFHDCITATLSRVGP